MDKLTTGNTGTLADYFAGWPGSKAPTVENEVAQAASFEDALQELWANDPSALAAAIEQNPTAFGESLYGSQKWYNDPTRWTGEIDTKNLQISGLDEETYRDFRSRLNSLNWNYNQGNLDDTQYAEAFNFLVEDAGIPTMGQGSDKIYWLDPGIDYNPYGVNIKGNFGERPGMYRTDARTDGDFSAGQFVENVGDYVTSPQGLFTLAMSAVPGLGQAGAAKLFADFGTDAVVQSLLRGDDGNYGVDDPLENAEAPTIGGQVVGSRPGWKWVRDATSVSGWKVVPVDEQPNEGGGGGGGSGTAGGSTGGASGNGSATPGGGGGEPEDIWVWDGSVLVNVETGATQQVQNPGRLEEGALYNQDAEPIGNDASEDEESGLVLGMPGGLGDWIIGGGIGGAVGQGVGDGAGGSGNTGGSSGQGGYGVVVTPNPSPQPGVNTGGTQNGMGQDGQQNTGGTGTGTGDGNGGSGSGEGNDGSGGGTLPSGNGLFSGGGSDAGDLFGYTQIRPSKAAQLNGMIDYVMALVGRR
jgi:hypothetical protein